LDERLAGEDGVGSELEEVCNGEAERWRGKHKSSNERARMESGRQVGK
jgi:hypothetical protein